MGATTWMYPDSTVTTEQAIALVRAPPHEHPRRPTRGYLAKVATFPYRPEIGTSWPRDGFALPSEDVFMRELARRSSSSTLLSLIDPVRRRRSPRGRAAAADRARAHPDRATRS